MPDRTSFKSWRAFERHFANDWDIRTVSNTLPATKKQIAYIRDIAAQLGIEIPDVRGLNRTRASRIIHVLLRRK